MSASSIQHPHEEVSNPIRELLAHTEPHSLRTFTPTLAVLARSAGIYHWTGEGRRLFDFTSGVLVANLGHNPKSWMKRFVEYMGWTGEPWEEGEKGRKGEREKEIANHSPSPLLPFSPSPPLPFSPSSFFAGMTLTAFNAGTYLEAESSRRLTELLQSRPGGKRLQQVLWAASGSEAVQKALWSAMARDRDRDMILATRFGFHGRKGLAGTTTGCETDRERDSRVHFFGFPMKECEDVAMRQQPFDASPYRRELEALEQQFGRRLGVLITEPYLGGAGSYHPPAGYLQMVQDFCRQERHRLHSR